VTFRIQLSLFMLLAISACATPPAPTVNAARPREQVAPDAHVPDFATRQYEPFSRESVVAIAMREWKMFDKPVDDDPPGTRPPPLPDEKPERWPGYWQRVGEYWWLGIDAGETESAWTGKHDADGRVFPARNDAQYAWSAAFTSYVMRIAGAGSRFPYAINHSDYINAAKQMTDGSASGLIVRAERPSAYAPQPGDMICLGRGRSGSLTYDDLPTGRFPAHCDIVVQTQPGVPGGWGQLSVIGGNVDDAVTMKHVPTTADGKLATPDGVIVDSRYPWLVVLRVLYDGAPVS
jgi:hypothetical protein